MRLIMPGAAAVAILLATGLAASAAVPSSAQDLGHKAPATGTVVLPRRGADDRAGDDRGGNHRGGNHRGGHDDGPNHG